MALTERYVTTGGTDTYANSTNINTPMSLTTALGNASAGDRINVKSGAYSQGSSAQSATNGGTVTSPIIYRGYATTITDGYLGRTNTTGALITTNLPVVTYTGTAGRITFGVFTLVESISFVSAASNATLTLGADAATRSCKALNSSTNASAAGIATAARDVIFDSDAELTGASGALAAISVGVANVRVLCCRCKGGPAAGISTSSSPIIFGCTIFVGATIGIATTNTGAVPTILCNTIVGNTGDGINILTGTTTLQCIFGNMVTDNTGDGIDMVSTANAAFSASNRTRDNANGYNNAGDWSTATKYGDVTTDTGAAATDYVASASNDYRLIFNSPAVYAALLGNTIGALQPNVIPELRVPSFPTI